MMFSGVTRFFDGGAVAISALCVAHCLLVPAAIVVAPTLNAVLDIPEIFHLWMLAIAIPVSGIALVTGYRMHRQTGPGMTGIFGLLMLAAGVLIAPSTFMEVMLTVAGSLFLASAHIRNWAFRNGAGYLEFS